MKKEKLKRSAYESQIKKDLKSKMVFLSGPRQVGKTTLAQGFIPNFRSGNLAYLNWDNDLDRTRMRTGDWPKDEKIIVFDEIHKRKGWQSWIKGYWDTWHEKQHYIVTGSARLETYRKGGDSMLGRYHHLTIHPFTLPELGYGADQLDHLFNFGGFPEPFVMKDKTQLKRWHLQRLSKLVRIDLRDLDSISDLDKIEVLASTLESRVGSPLSYRSLAEDLEVGDKTVKRWISILDSIYLSYLIPPFGSPKIRAIKKSQKLYLWDWSSIQSEGARFENMVAGHLLKWCDWQTEVLGEKTELRYLRTELGEEVDFVVVQNRKPIFAVECKLSDLSLSPSLIKLSKKLDIPMWYQVNLKSGTRQPSPNLKVVDFETLCKELSLV